MSFSKTLFYFNIVFIVTINCEDAPADEPVVPYHQFQISLIQAGFPCYNELNQAQRCVPEFVNAAFNRRVDATNTCGEYRSNEYCVQSGHSGMIKDCDICEARIPSRAHSAAFLTDFNNPENETWWQSETMNENIQFPNMVNLTLNLGKAFDITYVRLKFHSPRPESFAIYKKTRSNDTWIPWQYYSATCRSTYNLHDKAPILYGDETQAQCTSDYSDISPLTGADIAFSTLEGRPSAHNFENSSVLQEWVTATEIRIVLNRLNTFGDEVFGDDKVLRSYYYAISDFAVGGRCKCNGHASECVKSTGVGTERLVCRCEHFTMGEDCDQCMPFYNDRPWKPATADDANECKACDCNGLSSRCYFDEAMFALTGSGGHCIDCAGNTRGPHCENCLENYWRRPNDRYCVACNCNEMGSKTLQCDNEGKCVCKPGVTGQYCDRCLPGFYEFSVYGCKDCGCSEAGSLNNEPQCRADNGECACKSNVEGKKCDRCKPGHFNMDAKNEFGCTPCFCHGHSSICETAQGFFKFNITSDFSSGDDGWKIEGPSKRKIDAQYNDHDKNIAATEFGGVTYFVAPDMFLNNQRHSYNQYLTFKLRVVDRNSRASVRDIILQGANGQSISLPIFAQDNNPPDIYEQTYRYRLHEDPKFQWTPRLSSIDFMSILANLSAIKIRATYSPGDAGFIDDVTLGSASLTPVSTALHLKDQDPKANWIESCTCPEGFVGQNCESCAAGYRRDPKFGGPFARCIKCECHSHSEFCDAESGKCICKHNTAGDTCERCARGFYGNALKGTTEDCKPCPCPNQGPCILHTDNDVICLECAAGYAGRLCDICADGYYGDPKNQDECKLCECSGNIDPNSIGNCDRVTGECKKCIHNTQGFHCEKCSPGYYGDALLEPKGDCKKCNCYAPGTYKPQSNYRVLECEQPTGQCECLPHVTGRACDKCEPGYFNITSGIGCESCNCDPLGSLSSECDVASGQCRCKAGVVGKRCDQCQALHFGFSLKGCDSCDCLPIGSLSPQCDPLTGQCQCRSTVEGRRCDQCMENKYNLQAGCLDCDQCYTLIQKRVNKHRSQLAKVKDLLKDILENPTVVNDTNFETKLHELMKSIDIFAGIVSARMALESGDTAVQLQNLEKTLRDIENLAQQTEEVIQNTERLNEKTIQDRDRIAPVDNDTFIAVQKAKQYLQDEGQDAWEQAKLAADMYGQQSAQLTALAEEARKIADKLTDDADKIEEQIKKAFNASKAAEKGAVDAINGGQSMSQEISRLKSKFNVVDDLYNQTEQMSKDQIERLERLHQDSAFVLNQVEALKMPIVDTEKIIKEAADMSEAAKDVKSSAEEQAYNNKALVDQANKMAQDAEQELQRLKHVQQQIDSMLAEIDAAEARAKAALEMRQKTYDDIENALKTSSEFDALVEQRKTEAINAMEQVPSVEAKIEEAERYTKMAQEALSTAHEDAKTSQNMIQEAERLALEVSKEAETIEKETENVRFSSENLGEETEKIRNEIETKANTLSNYKTNKVEDKSKSQSALTEASNADYASKALNDTLSNHHRLVDEIMSQLNGLDSTNLNELQRLEVILNDFDNQDRQDFVDEKLNQLVKEEDARSKQIERFTDEIGKIEMEVLNLRQIAASLPLDKCFNHVPIEDTRR